MFQLSTAVVVALSFLLTIEAAPTSDLETLNLVAFASSDNSPDAQKLADQKKVITVATSDQHITATYGEKSPSDIQTLLVLESDQGSSDTTFVFGKDCDQTKCKTPAVKSVYAEQGTKNKTWSVGSLEGNLFQDSITLGGSKFTGLFGSVNKPTTYNKNDDGEFSLGMGSASGWSTLKALFDLGPERCVTIYRDSTANGQMLIGRNGHDKCKETKMYPTSSEGYWLIKDAKIKVDDKSIDKQKVEFSINELNVKIPQAQYDELVKDQKPDSKSLVGDINKLKSIELSLGSDVYVLKPEDFTDKKQDNKYYVKVQPTTSADRAQIVLGVPFLQKNCYVLNGKDNDVAKWQIGVGEHKNSATMLSAFAVLLVALAQLLRF